jgi:hypothetical protein
VNTQDRIDQDAWVDPEAVNWLAAIQGFANKGEHATYWRIVDKIRNKRILDLDVGTGRTIAFFTLGHGPIFRDRLPSRDA